MKLKRFIGTKEFYLTVISIALPIMAQQFVTSFVNLIDNVMIGSVGSIALTSVSVANKFYMIFNSTLFGICGASGIFIAQYFGAKNNKKCQNMFNINLIFSILSGILFTIALFVAPELIIKVFSKTPDIISTGVEYLKYIRFSYIPFAISMTMMMAMRSVGINKVQLKVGIVTVLTNTTLNYILIFGHFGFPALGVKGAAIATLIARLVEVTIYSSLLLRQKHFFKFDFSGLFHLDFPLMGKMMVKAIPLTINEILFSLGVALVFKSYMRIDEFLVAGISVVDTILNISFIIFGGLSSAVAIMIGNKLGANLIEEAKENSLKLIVFGCFVGMIIGGILFSVAGLVPSLYNLEPEINIAITKMLRIKSILIPIYVINVCVFFILRAGGDALNTLILDSGFLWSANVLVSTLLSLFTSLPLITVFTIVEGLDILKSFLAIYFYKKGKWARNMTI